MTETRWTVNAIKDAMRARGSHWFDPDTMRFFGTRVLPTVYQGPGGVYFVTEDDQYDRALPKRFTVRSFHETTKEIETMGKVGDHRTAEFAQEAAKRLAESERGEWTELTEAYQPVSVVEQVTHDLAAHGNFTGPPSAIEVHIHDLIDQARKHHRYMERLCGDERFCKQTDAEGNHPRVTDCRNTITSLARRLGAAGVIFSGDPRGCTVKLTFKDGYTNDFGKEGYCVPISTTE